MKIIITTTAPSLDSDIDPRFGRGANFLVVDPDTLEWEAHPNPGVNAMGGAGTQAAQFVVQQKADAVISGDFGPNAYIALAAVEIPMYLCGAGGSVRSVIERFKAGQLERVHAPTGPAMHGSGRRHR